MRAFVIMPFDDDFDGIYRELILPALNDAGYETSRADTTLNQRNILRDVIRGIWRPT